MSACTFETVKYTTQALRKLSLFLCHFIFAWQYTSVQFGVKSSICEVKAVPYFKQANLFIEMLPPLGIYKYIWLKYKKTLYITAFINNILKYFLQ